MICAVHAAVGAAIGKLVGKRLGAFGSGVATHLICDLLPHKDFDPRVEAPLLAATLGAIANRCGFRPTSAPASATAPPRNPRGPRVSSPPSACFSSCGRDPLRRRRSP